MSSNVNIVFCRLMLAGARDEAKQAGVKIPKLSVFDYIDAGPNTYYEVSAKINDKWEIVWQGTADNKFDARSKAIFKLIEDKGATNGQEN